MRKISTLLLIVLSALCIQSCKKDASIVKDKPAVDDKTYLLEKITWHYSDADYVEQFKYDDKNRLINVKYVGQFEDKYTYDTNDRLIEAKSYLDFYPNEYQISTYQYTDNKITASVKSSLPDSRITTYTFYLTDGRVTKAGIDDNDYAFMYTYDNKGNIVKVQELTVKSGEINDWKTFKYDDKKSPFAMVKGVNLHFMLSGLMPNYSIANNILDNYLMGGSFVTYKYNNAGFPISESIPRDNFPDLKVDYEYLIK